jgi:hypothetical protein
VGNPKWVKKYVPKEDIVNTGGGAVAFSILVYPDVNVVGSEKVQKAGTVLGGREKINVEVPRNN